MYDVVCAYDVGRTCAERALDVCGAGGEAAARTMWCACTTWAGRVLNVRWTCAELVVRLLRVVSWQ